MSHAFVLDRIGDPLYQLKIPWIARVRESFCSIESEIHCDPLKTLIEIHCDPLKTPWTLPNVRVCAFPVKRAKWRGQIARAAQVFFIFDVCIWKTHRRLLLSLFICHSQR